MPEAWSKKDERQYERIKQSAKDRGKSDNQAKEIASRTVNKERREEGRTRSGKQTTRGTGNPNRSLEGRTRKELENRAAELNVSGRSRMTKDQLVRAIRDKQ
jgi:hypothetical protein